LPLITTLLSYKSLVLGLGFHFSPLTHHPKSSAKIQRQNF
jgi:hypothetical protein